MECHREHTGGWPELAGHDLVLLLGSEWSVYWPHLAEAVAAESALVRAAQRAQVPMFAICYGQQMLAHALGGTVQRAAEPEIGWYDVVTDDPLVIAPGPWLQWHSDAVTLPSGATELARSGVGPQAWRLGRSFCTQFHPEATETMLDRWSSLGANELAEMGSSRDELMAITRANIDESRANAVHLVDRFCETI
jgi:GMP synthase-like glutamine amidotransferase